MSEFKRLKELTVLYVEDEISVMEEVSDMLSLKVGKLYTASNGEIGYEIYNKNKNIDIIITDIRMPVMGGLEMIELIRKENSDIPVIVTTAFNETYFLSQAIDLHVDKYITKPVDMIQLFSVLDRTSNVIFQKRELEQKDFMLKNKEKISAMGELIENIAHQWRQPLSVISSSATGIIMQKEFGTLTDESLEELCRNIENNVSSLSFTIDNFRNFFKKDEIPEQLNLKDIIDECYNVCLASFEHKQIKIIINTQDIEITGIKNNYMQILFTIFNNSKDLLEKLDIKEKYIFIDLKKEDNNIIIQIKDNAGGIEEENIPKVFEPYFTTKHKSQGTGLGLYMVYEIVAKSLNGDIKVQNTLYEYGGIQYKGAMFTIVL